MLKPWTPVPAGYHLEANYHLARANAIGETGLAEATFPPTCPYSIEQVLSDRFWPQ